jgi:hypothetical protein
MEMSDTYSEHCKECGLEREIEIEYTPAEKPSAHYPGAPEQLDWGETIGWCDCDETGEALDAMVERYRRKMIQEAEGTYARGYDDL